MARKERKVDSGLKWGEGYINRRTGPDGEPLFQARWGEGEGIDRRWRGKTFRSEDDAEDHLRTIARKKRSGTYSPESQLTVTECVNEYLERRRYDWAPNTYGTNIVHRVRCIDPYLGPKRIVQLTGHQVQLWLDTLARSGKRSKSGAVTGSLSRTTIASVRSLLNAALNDAVRFGMLDHNPVSGTRAGGRKAIERPVWNEDEAVRVLTGTMNDPLMHVIYTLFLLTGMRPGEIRAMHWRDVDLESGVIAVIPSMTRDEHDRETVGTTTKTGTSRKVKITGDLVDILKRHRRAQLERRIRHPNWYDDDIVFDRGDGRFIPQSTLQRRHLETIERAGVRRIRLHDLRHTYTSFQADSGVNPRAIMDALGHKRLSMTLEGYTHTSEDMRTAAAETISRRLLGRRTDTTTCEDPEAENG